MKFQLGDYVVISKHGHPYNKKTGVVLAIDMLYEKVKVGFQEPELSMYFASNEINATFRRPLNPFYPQKESFQHFECEKIRQLIDLALDTSDREWFYALTERYKELQKDE